MSKELIVDSSPHETRVAILEDDRLVDVYIERESEYPLAGSIFKGRVTRVLPGMQSAFVDIGLGRDAFLYVSDFFDDGEKEEHDAIASRPEAASETAESPAADPEPAPTKTDASIKPSRRERRGRRRRKPATREGFPESKYAPVGEQEASPQVDAPAEPTAPETEFAVLPGESLAKYRDRQPLAGKEDSGGSEPASEAADQPQRLAVANQPETSAAETTSDSEPDDQQSASGGGSSPAVSDEGGAPAEQPSPADPSSLASDADTGPSFSTNPDPDPPQTGGEIPAAGDEPDTSRATVSEGIPRPLSTLEAESGEAESPGHPGPFESPQTDSGEQLSEQAAPKSLTSPRSGGSFWDRLLSKSTPDKDDQPGTVSPAGTGGSPTEATEGSDAGDRQAAPSTEQAEDVSSDGYESEAEPGLADQDPEASLAEGSRESPAAASDAESGRGSSDLMTETETDGDPHAAESSADEPSAARPAKVRLRGRSSRYFRRRNRRQRPSEVPAGTAGDGAARESTKPEGESRQPRITDLLKEGQEVLVQISKEPLGRKGARITSHIALPGRYLVYMPTVEHTGVSRKIVSEAERRRLRKAVLAHSEGMPGGFIARTAGEGVEEDEIADDMNFLHGLWRGLRERADASPAPSRVHQDLDVVERILRDQLADAFKTIWVEGEDEYERILRFVERFQPDLLKQVKLYTRRKPIFDEFNITAELEKALRPKVWLKSGGYLVINQTEALVAIDVNTGKYVGKSDSLEETIVNTNLEAVQEVVRQMRLRDLGGIIVVDFIDMDDRTNRRKVMAALEQELELDRAPSKALRFNDFGLVAITRKRVKQSLERTLCTPCPYCHGSAYVKSAQTVALEILAEAKKMARSAKKRKDVTLRVNQEVARVLKSHDNTYLQDLEQLLGSHVLVRSDVSLHRENFGFH